MCASLILFPFTSFLLDPRAFKNFSRQSRPKCIAKSQLSINLTRTSREAAASNQPKKPVKKEGYPPLPESMIFLVTKAKTARRGTKQRV